MFLSVDPSYRSRLDALLSVFQRLIFPGQRVQLQSAPLPLA